MAVARNLWGYIDRRDHRLMRRMNRWRAPLDPHLDDRGHAHGRRLDLVRPGADAARVWRPPAFCGHRGCRLRGGSGHFCLQSAEETEPAAEALPDRAALLVEGAASGQVFV